MLSGVFVPSDFINIPLNFFGSLSESALWNYVK